MLDLSGRKKGQVGFPVSAEFVIVVIIILLLIGLIGTTILSVLIVSVFAFIFLWLNGKFGFFKMEFASLRPSPEKIDFSIIKNSIKNSARLLICLAIILAVAALAIFLLTSALSIKILYSPSFPFLSLLVAFILYGFGPSLLILVPFLSFYSGFLARLNHGAGAKNGAVCGALVNAIAIMTYILESLAILVIIGLIYGSYPTPPPESYVYLIYLAITIVPSTILGALGAWFAERYQGKTEKTSLKKAESPPARTFIK